MKKFVLSVALWACMSIAHAQIFLNELYVRQQNNEDQYFELYNANMTPANVGCYSVVTYFNNGVDRGFYVVDIPDTYIPARGFLVGSSSSPFRLRQGGQMTADVNWNAGNIARYVYRNGSLQLDNSGAPYDNVFSLSGNNNGNNSVYAVFLFNGSTLADAFLGSSDTTLVPQFITNMGTLNHTSTQNACGNINYDFGSINSESIDKFANVKQNAQPGKGYYREGNGPCPCQQNWIRAGVAADHTPGFANPVSGCGCDGSMLNVATACTQTNVNFTITGGNIGAYPLTVTFYNDVNGNGKLDTSDVALSSQTYPAYGGQRSFSKPAGAEFFLLAVDAQGMCDDKIVAVNCPAGIILPVNLKSFNAKRANTTVYLTWETATEINNLGFYVERLSGNGSWQTIAFVPSQAMGGNSNSVLSYSITDLNTFKGITQYRLRQVDIDGRYKYSEIRTVRSGDASAKILLYPNPTSTGTVNVVFDDATTVRDIYITDMSGRIMKQWKGVTNSSLVIDNLKSGVYMIRILDTQSGSQTTEKLVVNQ
jgi:uncharacterized protein (DUF2141 family)